MNKTAKDVIMEILLWARKPVATHELAGAYSLMYAGEPLRYSENNLATRASEMVRLGYTYGGKKYKIAGDYFGKKYKSWYVVPEPKLYHETKEQMILL